MTQAPGHTGSASVSVCFPAYNEEACIEAVLLDAHRLLSPTDLDYEILVIVDGATDQTGAIVDRLVDEIPRLRVVHHAENQGIRATFEHLYALATKELVFLNSTDQQWDTGVLLELLPMTDTWDIVIASRRDKHYGRLRALVSWGFNFLPRLLFGVPTYDAGAVKVMPREVITRFPLVSRSPFTEAERLIRAARAGYRITEFPVDVNDRSTGKSTGVSLELVRLALGDVARVWWSLRGQPRAGSRAARSG